MLGAMKPVAALPSPRLVRPAWVAAAAAAVTSAGSTVMVVSFLERLWGAGARPAPTSPRLGHEPPCAWVWLRRSSTDPWPL